ncbi:hypothetical protein [Streptomyces sp. NPDC047024]|uniref:hypothetical protein n=1 Tax=Streptomyces sp. NPDC047024 TaxID=3155476 RepID=UPI00340BE5EE
MLHRPQRPFRPPRLSPTPDRLTRDRDITHAHFKAGDQVIVLKGVVAGELWGESMRVVTPSWHTPTDEDGWRLRNPTGGQQTFVTAHPRYLIHLDGKCPECLIHLRAMEESVLPAFAGREDLVDCGWYTITELGQVVHVADRGAGR